MLNGLRLLPWTCQAHCFLLNKKRNVNELKTVKSRRWQREEKNEMIKALYGFVEGQRGQWNFLGGGLLENRMLCPTTADLHPVRRSYLPSSPTLCTETLTALKNYSTHDPQPKENRGRKSTSPLRSVLLEA